MKYILDKTNHADFKVVEAGRLAPRAYAVPHTKKSDAEKVDYKKWYFGFYHKDKYISTKAQAVYTDVYKIGD